MSDNYFALVKRFPLRPIRNAREYDAAVELMNTLAVRDEGMLDPGQQDYLDTLTLLVESYDKHNVRIDTSDVTPLEVLKASNGKPRDDHLRPRRSDRQPTSRLNDPGWQATNQP